MKLQKYYCESNQREKSIHGYEQVQEETTAGTVCGSCI